MHSLLRTSRCVVSNRAKKAASLEDLARADLLRSALICSKSSGDTSRRMGFSGTVGLLSATSAASLVTAAVASFSGP